MQIPKTTIQGKIPQTGRRPDEILAELSSRTQSDAQIRRARNFSIVYNAGEEHSTLIGDVLKNWHMYNMLGEFGPFKSLQAVETEIIAMTANLFHLPTDRLAGDITSGGTESIELAVKSARDWARKHKPWIRTPEIIISDTAHPCFQKSCELFGLKCTIVKSGSDKRANLETIRNALSRSTIMLVASAPCYPFGVVDPIPAISELAKQKNILCHVDACLGGFLLPFLEQNGHSIPAFDFRNPGVTSISADIHKFGFGPRGSSIILYRDKEVWRRQFFVAPNWSGYVYATRTLQGSRPGGVVLAAWAAIQHLGVDGYRDLARTLMSTSLRLQQGINAINGLQVISNPESAVFAFTTTDERLDVFNLSAMMKEKGGWWIDPQQNPPSIHMTVSPVHVEIVDEFLNDLKFVVTKLRSSTSFGSQEAKLNRFIATYPDRTLVSELIEDHLLNMTNLKEKNDDAIINMLSKPIVKKILSYRIGQWALRILYRLSKISYFQSKS